MRRINVVGYRFYDIVLYLAAILRYLGASVIVIDETLDFRLYDYLPIVDGMDNSGVTELRGVRYTQSRLNVAEESADYCFVIRNADQIASEDEKAELFVRDQETEWLFITDEDASHVRNTEVVYDAVRNSEKRPGMADMHVPVRIIRGNTGMTKSLCRGMTERDKTGLFILPYIERDRKAELYLSIREDVSFRPISERLSSVVEKIIYIIRPGTKVVEFERAFAAMMKGGAG